MRTILLKIAMILSLSTGAREISIDCVKEYIIEVGIQHPIIVAKQAVKESGWVKSHETIRLNTQNNILGFMLKGKIIEFNSWYDCVLYYKRWQERRYKGGDYYKFIEESGYCHDCPDYTNDLKRINV